MALGGLHGMLWQQGTLGTQGVRMLFQGTRVEGLLPGLSPGGHSAPSRAWRGADCCPGSVRSATPPRQAALVHHKGHVPFQALELVLNCLGCQARGKE